MIEHIMAHVQLESSENGCVLFYVLFRFSLLRTKGLRIRYYSPLE